MSSMRPFLALLVNLKLDAADEDGGGGNLSDSVIDKRAAPRLQIHVDTNVRSLSRAPAICKSMVRHPLSTKFPGPGRTA